MLAPVFPSISTTARFAIVPFLRFVCRRAFPAPPTTPVVCDAILYCATPPYTTVGANAARFLYCWLRDLLLCSTPLHIFFFTHIYFSASGQAVVTGVVPSLPRFLPSVFIAHRVQQSHCSSIFRRVLLTHALALSASHFVRKENSPRIYTSMHSGGLELTKLAYTRLEDNLIRHRGDRLLLGDPYCATPLHCT